jgi:arsenical pump membrane protein
MDAAAAVSALVVTLGLVLRSPPLPRGLRIGPAAAAALGVSFLLLAGLIAVSDVTAAWHMLWRPLVALASIMVITGVATRVGLFRQLSVLVIPAEGVPAGRLFALVFGLGFATASVFNNDAAILVLTPVVVGLVRGLFPDIPAAVVPFAFAVFMAAGVAPFLTSNPMNTVLAGAAGIDFNAYAIRMVPVAVVAAAVTYAVLRWLFARELAALPPTGPPPPRTPWTAGQRRLLVLVLLVLVAYPVAALAGGEVYLVAATGALAALALAWRSGAGRPVELVRSAVAWQILAFLLGMFLLARGLQNAGAVNQLAGLYEQAGTTAIGVVSALGSAVINNHSMALINLLAIPAVPDAGRDGYLAALVGGDLGPRLLPVGSLAGLLWLALLRRLGIDVPLRRFILVGAAVTIPSLAASLAILALNPL